MHLRAEYQGLLASLTQDEPIPSRPQSSGTGSGSQPENQSPQQRPSRPNQGDLHRIPHSSGRHHSRSQR